MNTITRIKELDIYLVTFMDQNTVHNYSILSKETNKIITTHDLYILLKEYHKERYNYKNKLTWAIETDKPYILDWYVRIGFKFDNIFEMVDRTIVCSSTKVLDWFYRKGIFDYTIASLHGAVLNGALGSIDWFYNHDLETAYLEKLLDEPEIIFKNKYNHEKLLTILKWLYQKKKLPDFDIHKILLRISEGSAELIEWLSECRMITGSILSGWQYHFSYDMKNLTIEKQIETLSLLKKLEYHFNETKNKQLEEQTKGSLFECPIEVRKWCLENIPGITLQQIFSFAAITGDIEAMKWTGIDKNHPNFGLINHNFVLEQAIKYYHVAVIDWYFENISFNGKTLDDLLVAFKRIRYPTIEKIMLFEKIFGRHNLHYNSAYLAATKNAFTGANIPVLEYLLTKLSSKSKICIYTEEIASCISNGYIDSLKWVEKYLCKDAPNIKIGKKIIKIKFVDDYHGLGMAIGNAAYDGHIETIKWAKHFFPHKMNYKTAIDNAASRRKPDVLNWFNKLFGDSAEFEYSDIAIDNAAYNSDVRILKWFHFSDHPLKYSSTAIENSFRYEKIHILQWLKENGYPMVFDIRIIHIACTSYMAALQWLRDSGVIKILSKEIRNDLLVFMVELAQPFAKSERTNVVYHDTNYQQPVNDYFDVKYVDKSSTQDRHSSSNEDPDSDSGTKIIEIRYKYNKLNDVFASTVNYATKAIINTYHGMCWFERWSRLLK